MLTVNHIDGRLNETLYEVTEVRRVRANQGAGVSADLGLQPGVHITLASGGTVHFNEAHCASRDEQTPQIFVMNEHGKTVARYDL